jgi:hypothetical protein
VVCRGKKSGRKPASRKEAKTIGAEGKIPVEPKFNGVRIVDSKKAIESNLSHRKARSHFKKSSGALACKVENDEKQSFGVRLSLRASETITAWAIRLMVSGLLPAFLSRF